ncbi:hypothetical protein B0T14DRAFT_495975 [Immersiella caudata]|uniref:Uncharacterized protein n=1 Tax=Immersiella caudata TaxID=314043 RepID=A0AA39WPI3_9PEZI|nr:hypothetical protein B0T14DRAFT_495975 [Immersiella caudata]
MSTGPLPLPSPRISEGGDDWGRSRSPSPNPALRGRNPEMAGSGRVSPEDTSLNDPLDHGGPTSYQPLHWEKGHIKEHKGRPHVIRYWPLEIAGIGGALIMMAVTIFLLWFFHGKDYYDSWGRYTSIGFTTVIATLATATRSCMLFGVAEIIGQLKWVWFTRRTRPLYHLYQFDEASRGIIGSLEILPMLFKNLRSRLSAYALAAVAIVLVGSAFGPSTQQALGLRPCNITLTNTTAQVPIANFATGDLYRIPGGTEVEATVDMKGLIVEALTNPSDVETSVKANCTSGRCYFPTYGTNTTYASIGLCSRCIDRTASATRLSTGIVTLPLSGLLPSLRINTIPPYEPFLSAAFLPSSPFDADLSDRALGSVHILTGKHPTPNSAQSASYTAVTCTLYPCLKTYHGSVAGGRLTESVLTTVPTVKQPSGADPNTGNYTAIRLPCPLDPNPWDNTATLYNDQNIANAEPSPHRTWGTFRLPGSAAESPVPNACLYKLDIEYGKALTKFFSTLLNGTCTYDTLQGDDLQCGDKWWLSQLYFGGYADFLRLSYVFGNLSTVVTNRLRITGWGPDQHRAPTAPGGTTLQWKGPGYGVDGTVQVRVTCMYFDWPWIIPPAVMLLTSTALLIWTVTKNYTEQRIPLWKSDPLPLMFFGFGKKGVTGRDVPDDVTISAMHRKAKGIQVRCLVGDEEEGPGLIKTVGMGGLRRRVPGGDGREGYRMESMDARLLEEDV